MLQGPVAQPLAAPSMSDPGRRLSAASIIATILHILSAFDIRLACSDPCNVRPAFRGPGRR